MNTSLFNCTNCNEYNQSLERILDFYLCGCMDFPKSGIDCSVRSPNICFRCTFFGTYFTRETIDDYNSMGHLTCRIIAVVTPLLAIIGVMTNFLLIWIIRKRSSKCSFDYQLSTLALADALCCLSCITYCGAHVAYYDNIFGRSKFTLYWLMYSSAAVLTWRVLSMYLTLMVSIERYLAIAYPLRSRIWFSIEKTKLQTVIITLLVILVTTPAYIRLYVGPNIYGRQIGGLDVPSFRGFKYTYLPTKYHSYFNADNYLGIITFLIDYYIPIGSLLVFNVLTYRECNKLNKKRQDLTSSQRQELQPAKMFLPVIVIAIFTNIWPSVMHSTVLVWGINFREIWMSVFLGNVVNCSVNFWIFYFRATSFRKETKSALSELTITFNTSPNLANKTIK